MNILVTGARGFIGKNLIANLMQQKQYQIFECSRDTKAELIIEYCKKADFIFHLAGVNRSKCKYDFMNTNLGFTEILLKTLKKYNNNCSIVFSSSVQAEINNLYGKSKKAAEDVLLEYAKITKNHVYIYRLPNVFGKWSRPDYNSVVATFCHNIANDIEINIDDRSTSLNLAYIDDVVKEMMLPLEKIPKVQGGFCNIPVVYTVSLEQLAKCIKSFKNTRKNISIPNMSDNFIKKLYSTYLSYLPTNNFSYPLIMHEDNRGNFTEILRSPKRGQVSVNISKPGIIKGNHWHNTKNEKFIVLSGNALIRLRELYSTNIIEYHLNERSIEVIDIPPGYVHSIINEGEKDLVTLIWCNECFDINDQDTYLGQV